MTEERLVSATVNGDVVDIEANLTLFFEKFGPNPQVWGALLADIAQHMAQATSQFVTREGKKVEPQEVFNDIMLTFAEHLEGSNFNLPYQLIIQESDVN